VEGQKGLTVQELLTPWYAKLGLLGLLGPALAGIPIVIGIFAIGGTVSIPVSGTELLSGGLIAIVLSYVLLVYASALGAIEWATGDELNLSPFSEG
jgi:hypothetical protein